MIWDKIVHYCTVKIGFYFVRVNCAMHYGLFQRYFVDNGDNNNKLYYIGIILYVRSNFYVLLVKKTSHKHSVPKS